MSLIKRFGQFINENLEQGPEKVNPTAPPTVTPGGAQPAPKVGFGGAKYDPQGTFGLTTSLRDLIRKIASGAFSRATGKDLLNLVENKLAPDQATYDETIGIINAEFNKAGIIPFFVSLDMRRSTTQDAYIKMAYLGMGNSMIDEYREDLNKIEYYLRRFKNPKEKWSLYVTENIDHDAQHETENYMFFGNLETIKRLCEALLEMDPLEVDSILKNGHSWAVDHIATSKDDVEEVFNFIKNEVDEPAEDEKDSARYTMSRYSEDELDQMTRDQIEHDEMMLRREQGI
jgi:hypothetical protein